MFLQSIETSIDIAAPVGRVWDVLTDFPSYPAWSRFIVSIAGEPRAGTRLGVRLEDGGGTMQIRPTVIVAEAGRELRWRGTLGLQSLFCGEHYFQLEARRQGTRLIHGEHFSGLLVLLLWTRLDTGTRQAFADFNTRLKRRTEMRAD